MSNGDLDIQGLRRLVDLVLPGNGHLPAANDLADFDRWMARALVAAGPAANAVIDFAKRAGAVDQVDALTIEHVQKWGATDAESVVFVLTCAYYMSPTVRELLGYPGQGHRPVAGALAVELADDELLRPVVERGAVYVTRPRRTGEGAQVMQGPKEDVVDS